MGYAYVLERQEYHSFCDSEETYKFIEAEIAKMRRVFKSNKIHIGMDEAHDVGLGKYLRKYGILIDIRF